ncbi:Proteophosphoglycan ppg4 [Rhodotorula toruloides ATCC 204091]|uniref:LysM domain-containing protein n=1 Tax=Rhodotorula toruloides TaxID=5286 RepID=A0A2T0AEN2_RHOTO|nr:Proteophosphoglycan ppg4 [Rhodotorula toruloides ATCC 204091]KAK4335038.1 Proteophosphoglycan ppg4 [Rhodotorula toruloides]PRQ76465.1 hypothetical protein AAT19DRAFT_13487 [Rhodotorula toruloides]
MTATRPSRSSTPTSHPLIHQPHTDPLPTASSSSLLVSPTVSRPPSPLLVSRASTPNGAGSSGGGGIRSRRSPLPHPTTLAEVESAAATSSVGTGSLVGGLVEPDVTRPSLRRATNDALGVLDGVRGEADDGRGEGYVLKTDRKGKGKAREYARTNGAGGTKEREVIVHKVQKTDTFASISLQYGITPQALRTSNRLWPSDPLFLRSELLIPLDLCNLPSSSFGVERIAREENGDLTVWEKRAREGGRLGDAAERERREGEVVSPLARRASPIAGLADVDRGFGRDGAAENEFLSVWEEEVTATQPPLTPDIVAPVHAGPSSFGTVAAPTATVSARPSIDDDRPLSIEEIVSRTVSPSFSTSASTTTPSTSFSPEPPASPGSASPSGESALAKRTLRIARLPASDLAFFPAPTSHPPSPKKPPPSARVPSRPSKATSESLFFGPLTDSLTSSLSSLGLDKYLPSASSSSSSSAIRLPPSPASERGRRRKSGWGLLDFGAEEDEAFTASGSAGGAGDYFATGSEAGAGTGRRGKVKKGVNGVVGLEDAETWSRRSTTLDGASANGAGGSAPGRARGDVRDTFGLR